MPSAVAGQLLPATDSGIDIGRVELRSKAAPTGALGGDRRRAATQKSVEHDVAAGGAVELTSATGFTVGWSSSKFPSSVLREKELTPA